METKKKEDREWEWEKLESKVERKIMDKKKYVQLLSVRVGGIAGQI